MRFHISFGEGKLRKKGSVKELRTAQAAYQKISNPCPRVKAPTRGFCAQVCGVSQNIGISDNKPIQPIIEDN